MSLTIASFKLLMGLPDAFILINNEGQILCANVAAGRLLKNNEKLLRQKDLSDYTDDEPEKVQQFIARWSRSGNSLPAPLKIHCQSELGKGTEFRIDFPHNTHDLLH